MRIENIPYYSVHESREVAWKLFFEKNIVVVNGVCVRTCVGYV